MDATIQALFAVLPAPWRPYVVLALLASYLITKWRSYRKSEALKTVEEYRKMIDPVRAPAPKRCPLAAVIDFLF